MVSLEPDIRNAEIFHTNASVSGSAAGLAVQNGNNIPDDMTRYIYKIRMTNSGAGPHIVNVWAGDAANTKRRLIFTTYLLAFARLDWPAQGKPNASALKVVPNTTVAPTQENGIYVSDDGAGGIITNITLSYFDKRE